MTHHAASSVEINDETLIGAGVTVNNNATIYGGCMVGLGVVVVDVIMERWTYLGLHENRLHSRKG